ncbi:MAG: PLP-dependent aminotransferase family protein [Polyangiaceae bacterium]
MRSFRPQLTLAGRRSSSLGIARNLRAALQRGQLQAGEYLPSTRELARDFAVHRHTVLAALNLLVSEGLLDAKPRRGFRVTEEARVALPPARRPPSSWHGFRLVREVPQLVAPPASSVPYPLHSATPDPALAPHVELKSAYAQVLRQKRHELFELGDERGLPAFRDVLGAHLRQHRGLVARDSMVTHGSQDGISLVARALLGPGDVVAVEDPGYSPAWDAFRAVGARIVGVRVDEQGLDIDAFARLLGRRRVRLLYTTPAHQFPTSVTLSASRRRALLALTARYGVPILEDDYDHEYQYVGLPPPPLAAAADAHHVIYVATLSKLIGGGMRLGCVVAGSHLIDALIGLNRIGARGHDPISQAALAAWMSDGGLERHLRRARRAYGARREALRNALAPGQALGLVSVEPSTGGLGLWARWHGIDSLALAERSREAGVLVLPESLLRLRPRVHDGTRIAFSRCPTERLSTAASTLVRIAARLRR